MYTNRIFRLLAVATLALAGVLALLLILPASSPGAVQASPLESQAPPFSAGEGGQEVRSPTAGAVRYVATTGLDAGDCITSTNPCRTVQYAVDVADEGDEIKVATGVYTDVSVRPRNDVTTTGIVTQVVYVSKTVTIQGGYTMTNWNISNPTSYPTTLDAQSQGRVLYIAGNISPTIEGVRITGGVNDTGGGAYIIADIVTISNCQVFDNVASDGGGLYLYATTATLTSNIIISNTTWFGKGGGLYLGSGAAILSNNIVHANEARYGGGLYLGSSHAVLEGNTIAENTAFYYGSGGSGGGGLYLWSSVAILNNNTLSSNIATHSGTSSSKGSGGYAYSSTITLYKNTIISNTTYGYGDGAGLYLDFSNTTLNANIIASNSAHDGGGLYLRGGEATFNDNTIALNVANLFGGGLYTYLSTVALRDNTFSANFASSSGGGINLNNSNAVLHGNIITGNTTSYASGGGGLSLSDSEVELNANFVAHNTASSGGGLMLHSSNAVTLTNNVIVGNYAYLYGSGLFISGSPQLMHTTIACNTGGDGSGIYVYNGSPILTNTILVSQAVGISITTGNTATLGSTLWHGNTQDWGGAGTILTGTINVWGDPAFVNPNAGDYHIGPDSLAINAGVDAGVTTDIDGDPRPLGGGYDIGADEFYGIGVYLLPPGQAGSGGPGDTVSYAAQLINQTGITDSFTLSIQPGNAWTTTLSLTQTGALPNGASLPFTVEVEIPSSALPGDWDSATVQAASVTSPTVFSDTATFTTTAHFNSAPVAADDSGPGFITDEDTAFTTASVLTNDTDPDGDPLSVQSFDASGTLGLVTFGGSGTAGSLDTSGFGAPNGYVTTDFGFSDIGYDIAIQPDGKIVVAGYTVNGSNSDFAVARYNPDGSLDAFFDDDGLVTTDFGFNDYGQCVVIQPDGKIVVAGEADNGSSSDFAVVRYNPDGSLDTSFDSDGKITTNFGPYDEGHGVAIQSDGKLVVAGMAYNGSNNDFALARYNPDGSLDTSFDGDGKVTTDFFGDSDNGRSLAIQADGKIVVAGQTYVDFTSVDFALVRYNTNGSLDTSFDDDGKVTTNLGSDQDFAEDIAIQSDGKIVVVGSASSDFAAARYNLDGNLDTAFNDDGKVITDFGSYDVGRSIAIQLNGKIIVAGTTDNGNNPDFAVARYNTDGSLDISFDGDGMVTTDLGNDDSGRGIAIQPDGKLVVAGYTINGATSDFAVARYNAGGGNAFIYGPNDQFEWLAAGQVATDTFTYVVSDGALTDTATVSITVIGVNAAPVAVDDSGPGFTTDENTAFTTTSVLTNDIDLDGDPLTVQSYDASGTLGLVSPGGGDGTFIYNPNGQFEWLAAGEVATDTFTYVVSDGALTDTATVSITIIGVNDAPVLGTIGDKSIDEGIQLTFTVTATDVDLSDSLTFSLDAGSVGSITAGGVFTWTPTEAQGPGIYTATLRVSDGVLDNAETITITVSEVNAAPVLAPIGNKAVDELATLVFTATATDGDIPTQTLTFSLDAGSVGSLTAGGVFTWTPQTAGSYTATVRVTDDGILPLDDAETITITVNEVSAAPGTPSLLWPANGTLTTTQAITLTWQATPGAQPDGYNVQLDGTIITTTETFSATILPFGVHTWTVRAYNAEGYSNWAGPAWTVEVVQHRIYLPIVLR